MERPLPPAKVEVKLINFSAIALTEDMTNLLLRGLKFTPTPQYPNIPQLQCDLKVFARTLRLKEQFYGKDDVDNSLLRNNSSWIPMPNRDKSLEDCVRRLYRLADSLEDETFPAITPNLPTSELKAFSELRNLIKEKKLLITESDKGGFICLFDPPYIREMGFSTLKNEALFKQTDSVCDHNVLLEIKNLIKSHKPPKYDYAVLTAKEEDYLTNFESKTASFYLLPKVLKSEEVKSKTATPKTSIISLPPPNDLKFRYIIGGPNSVTSRLSQLIDLILRPLITQIPGYLKDSYDVIRMIDAEWRPLLNNQRGNYTLYTWDIKEFYPSLNYELVKKSVLFWLERHPSLIDPRFAKSFIVGGLHIIMSRSNCKFDDVFFQFEKGLPTGTPAAVTLAVLVRGYLMESLYTNILRKYGLVVQLFVIKHLRAFIDDNISLWNNELGQINIVNDEFERIYQEEGIKFVLIPPEISDQNGSTTHRQYFLDLDISISGSKIVIDMFDKSCHNFVPWQSCHPHGTKKNIPYSLALRIRTICDSEEDQNRRFINLRSYLSHLGYPSALIEDAITRTKLRDQGDLRKDSNSTNNNAENEKSVLPFVHTYNPKNPNIFPRISSCLKILDESPKMKFIMSQTTPIPSRRQPPNLKLLLTSSNFTMQDKEHSVTKCNDTRHNCQCCENIVEGNNIEMENGDIFVIQQSMNCKTENVVYVLFCMGCKKTYIGETGQKLCARASEHRCHILNKNYRALEVSHHVFECAGTLPIPFKIMPIYKMTLNCSRIERESKEFFFQKKFCPSLHPGPRITDDSE